MKKYLILFMLSICLVTNGQRIKYSSYSNVSSITVPAGSSLFNNLISYWKLNETSGNAVDSKNRNIGYINTGVTQGVSGKIGTAYSFSGTGSINAGHDISLCLTNVGTLSAWAKLTTITTYTAIAGKTGGSHDTGGYLIESYPSGHVYGWVIQSNGIYVYVDMGAPSLDTWYFYVLKWDGTYVYAYINGTQVDKQSQSGYVVPVTIYDFLIGRNYGTYNGIIDEVGVWNRALTPTEITILYNSGNGLTFPFN